MKRILLVLAVLLWLPLAGAAEVGLNGGFIGTWLAPKAQMTIRQSDSILVVEFQPQQLPPKTFAAQLTGKGTAVLKSSNNVDYQLELRGDQYLIVTGPRGKSTTYERYVP